MARMLCAALAALLSGLAPAVAETWPTRPVKFLVSFPPGGSADVVVRAIQPFVEKQLGQPLVIENRGGAGGVIGVDAVVKSAPDGYTVGLGAAGALAVNVSLQQKMPYDPLKDIAPVSLLSAIPFILIAPSALPAASIQDAIALAKAKPETSIGHGGNGTAMHLTAQLFNHMAQVNITLVPYRGSGPVASDVLAGHVPFGITDIPSAISLIRDGKVKALAVSSSRRYPLLPELPTFAESGLPGFESVGWFGVVAPAGTPPEIIAKLNAAITGALKDPEVRERVLAIGADPTPTTPGEFAAFIRSEITKWERVVAQAGGKAN
jgi:tripartite-type tricarboxylate transporter receptor subunit TctC